MINCNNIRKIVINQILPNGDVLNSVIYFDISTGDQIASNLVSKCGEIESINFSCAIVCNPSEEVSNCWLSINDECWITESGQPWIFE